jgi:hypothetical protein
MEDERALRLVDHDRSCAIEHELARERVGQHRHEQLAEQQALFSRTRDARRAAAARIADRYDARPQLGHPDPERRLEVVARIRRRDPQ